MLFGKPQIQIETVFARTGIVKDHVVEHARLHAAGAVIGGIAHASPRCGRLGRFPAEKANGRSGVGNAFEGADFAVGTDDAFENSAGGTLLNGTQLGAGRGGEEQNAGQEKEG
jgi:hypothetical protein